MALLDTVLASAQGGQASNRQSSGQGGGSGPGTMKLLSKASRSGHSAVVSGAMSLVSAYRSRKKNRQRAMERAVLGVALLGFGFWQIQRKSGSGGSKSSGGQSSKGRSGPSAA